jgi:hypothetical protein
LQAMLGALQERAEVYVDLVEYHEFNGLTVDELNAARAHLALHHGVADRLAACVAGMVMPSEPSTVAAFRQALYALLGTEQLAYTINNERVNALPGDD